MIPAQGAGGPHPARHSKNPLEEIEIMRALVEKHAAPLATPGRAPAAGRVIRLGAEPIGDDPVDPADRAEFAAVNHFANFDVIRVSALVKHLGEHDRLPGMPGNKPLAIGLVDPERFFGEHMETGSERRQPDGGMCVVRRGDDNGVHRAGLEEFLVCGEARPILEFLQPCWIQITDRAEHAPVDFVGQNVAGMAPAHVAQPHNPESNLIHINLCELRMMKCFRLTLVPNL